MLLSIIADVTAATDNDNNNDVDDDDNDVISRCCLYCIAVELTQLIDEHEI